MTMHHLIIEPRDPLIVRDGKSFDASPGARAVSLPFPLPATIAGAVRNRAGTWTGDKTQDAAQAAIVLQRHVHGPLLAQLDAAGSVDEWFAPAPADATFLRRANDEQHADLFQLTPRAFDTGVMARPVEGAALLPVQIGSGAKEKAYPGAPMFWSWNKLRAWLLAPADMPQVVAADFGLRALAEDSRVHVGINATSQTADDGALFVTRGREFSYAEPKARSQATTSDGADSEPRVRLSDVRRLALLVRTSEPLPAGVGPLGGERRLSAWRTTDTTFAQPDAAIIAQLAETGRCRVLLLTPAHFAAGFRPHRLLSTQHDVTPQLRAAAVGRPTAVSGWDMLANSARPGRRLAPAGSVYWLELDGDAAARRAWAAAIWMQTVSDGDQERRDGFGLAVLGTWEETR